MRRSKKIKTTLVAIPKGYNFIKIIHTENLVIKAVKEIQTGSEIKDMYFDSLTPKVKKGKVISSKNL